MDGKTVERTNPPAKPELLAPAGSPQTWAAALEAGADAVYLGLKSFSARALAPNFTLTDLTRVIESTRARGAKIFVAFNSLLKEAELRPALSLLDELAHLAPNALIVQDLGLFRLIKRYYPQFELHASTLMAVHNQPGLAVLEKLGFHRAVLARELTLDEVAGLTTRTRLGLEIFIHGALCFSFSGLCLMSSFLGGKGSLRGACTQPCRRIYSTEQKKGYLFSPTDLDASSLIERIRTLPLAALKIEGRMKGADYVFRVVRAYRLLLDAAGHEAVAALEEARELIAGSHGRPRSTGFLAGLDMGRTLTPARATTSGTYLGRVEESGPGGLVLTLLAPVGVGDRLRIKHKEDDQQDAFTLKGLTISGASEPADSAKDGPVGAKVVLTGSPPASPGDLVFLVTSAGSRIADPSPLLAGWPKERSRWGIHPPSPNLKKALEEIQGPVRPGRGSLRQAGFWYRLARLEDATGLTALNPERVIIPITTANVKRLPQIRQRLGPLLERLIWAAPPLTFPAAVAALGRNITYLVQMGAREFMITNLGHLGLLAALDYGRARRPTAYADYRLNALNTQTEALLAEQGLAGITLNIETDRENLALLLERSGPVRRFLYVFGRPPLFTSRFAPAGIKDGQPIISPRGERFRSRQERDVFRLISEIPIFLPPDPGGRTRPGIDAYIVDLEMDPRPATTAREVHEALTRGRSLKHTSSFNLNRILF